MLALSQQCQRGFGLAAGALPEEAHIGCQQKFGIEGRIAAAGRQRYMQLRRALTQRGCQRQEAAVRFAGRRAHAA